MKRFAYNFAAAAFLALLAIPAISQDDKEKDKDKKKEAEQIIITRKGDTKNKVVIEVDGDKVTINGKPADEYKDGDIKVRRNKIKTTEGLNYYSYSFPGENEDNLNFNWNDNEGMHFYGNMDENRAMLGVVTENADEGAKVTDVTDESAAKIAGIKEGDIITKIDDTKIEEPDDLSAAVRKHKPGDKITVTFLRDKKEQKVTAELGKWKGTNVLVAPHAPNMRLFDENLPRAFAMPRTPYSYSWSGSGPRLGLSVQDTDDGKGVKVIDVDEDGNAAKAGIKEDDIITHVNDKEVNSADDVAKLVKENKDKQSIQLKIKRAGKVQTITVKMPRKLKTADL